MKQHFESVTIGERRIVVKGIGKMFYQDGFPIPMSISRFRDAGYEVSMLHIADELLKNGFTKKRTMASLCDDVIVGDEKVNEALISKFCDVDYDEQRAMIFEYLFSSKEQASSFVKNMFV